MPMAPREFAKSARRELYLAGAAARIARVPQRAKRRDMALFTRYLLMREAASAFDAYTMLPLF